MPTLLQINATANWGSTGRIAEQIGNAAIQAGWKSYIAFGRHNGESSSRLIRIGNNIDVYFHALMARFFDCAGLCSRHATKRFIKRLSKIKPDIVHLHNIHGYYVNYKLLFEYLSTTDIKVVWTFHDCWAFTGHCPHFINIGCYKWRTQCYSCPLKKEYPSSILFDNSKKNYSIKKNVFSKLPVHIVSVSNWMNDLVSQSFMQNNNLSIIHNGIDINVFKPITFKERSLYRILAVSNIWTNDKGLNDLYRLRVLLSSEYEIHIVGLTDDQIGQLPSGICGFKRTASVEELVDAYTSADVLVNPTYADTFPTVNLESLACGTPVITYNTGGSPEAIDELTGVIVEQGNVEALAEAIINLKNNPLSSHACRERARQLFDKDRCFDKYIELYQSLVCQK